MSFARNIFQGSGVLLAANIISKALSVLTLPLLTLWLSPDLYGEAALASTLISLLSVIALAGMDMSYSRAYFGVDKISTEQVESLVWRCGVVSGAVAGLIGGLIWYVYSRQNELHTELSILIALGVLGSLLLSLAQTRARLKKHYMRLALVVLASALTSYALMLMLAYPVFLKPFSLLVGYVSVYWLTILFLSKPSIKKIFSSQNQLSAKESKSILLVGLPGVITAPAFWVLSSADRWFLDVYASTDSVGIYAIAVSFGTLGMMLNNAVLSAWVPEAVRHHETNLDGSYESIAKAKQSVISAYAFVWAGVVALSPEMIRMLVDPRFHEAIGLVPWIAGGVFFYGCSHLFNTALYLQRRLHITAAVWIVAVMISLTLNRIGVPKFGMEAAAAVQCVAFASAAVAVAWFARHSLRRHVLTAKLVLFLLISLVLGLCLAGFESDIMFSGLIIKALILLGYFLVLSGAYFPESIRRICKRYIGGVA